MLPLSSSRTDVRGRVSDIDKQTLWGGGTMTHLGVTWARRMLAPTWRSVWGDGIHPVSTSDFPDGEVTKAIVLLTDGANALIDDPRFLPGEIGVQSVSGGGVMPGCNARGSAGCTRFGDDEPVTRYSALGRLSDSTSGRAEDGHIYSPDRDSWGTARINFRTGLNELLAQSCALAHAEGLTIFTVFAGRGREERLGADDLLEMSCAGAASVPVDERSEYHFLVTNPEALAAAFREVGHRLVGLRRTM